MNRDLKKSIQRILTKFGTFCPNFQYLLYFKFHTTPLKNVETTPASIVYPVQLEQGVFLRPFSLNDRKIRHTMHAKCISMHFSMELYENGYTINMDNFDQKHQICFKSE